MTKILWFITLNLGIGILVYSIGIIVAMAIATIKFDKNKIPNYIFEDKFKSNFTNYVIENEQLKIIYSNSKKIFLLLFFWVYYAPFILTVVYHSAKEAFA